MLKIKNITKIYKMGDNVVEALKGVSINFRKHEFVSILGPSGCGKTTLLNIIGGLDRYTEGDLVINGISTKEYKDKDWDTYRNHKIGFIFQSYNLIPHQTVLENVELALTLSGVSRDERKKRAAAVLQRVGLGDKLKNRPNQLSGGQMQRVAIARALVNDPEIILADEPTGALDTESSVQIMELLKEISADKLIVMVTHNPELAQKYSSRIVRMLDGKLVDDSDPFEGIVYPPVEPKVLTKEEKKAENKAKRAGRKRRMSYFTALFLSLKNLLTKKTRTALVAFAGSIGIIGIALVLAISSGFNTYVNKMQEDTLSTYPITIEAKNIDLTSAIMTMFMDTEEGKLTHPLDGVYPRDKISNVLNDVGTNLKPNNLKAFYKYVNDHYDEIKDYINDVQCTYNIGAEFYATDTTNSAVEPNSMALMQMIIMYSLFYFENNANVVVTQYNYGLGGCKLEKKPDSEPNWKFIDRFAELSDIRTQLYNTGVVELPSAQQVIKLVYGIMGLKSSGSVNVSFGMSVFGEMIDNDKLIKSQYDVVAGHYIENANEALLVLDKNNEMDEYLLFTLGLISNEEMSQKLQLLAQGTKTQKQIAFDSILGTEYKILTDSDYYVNISSDPENPNVVDIRKEYLRYSTDADGNITGTYFDSQYYVLLAQIKAAATNSIKIVGVVRPNKSTSSGSLSAGVVYSHDLTKALIEYQNSSLAVTAAGCEKLSLDNPASINIYVNKFSSKAKIEKFVDKYNKQAAQGDEITYTDYVGLIMSTVSTIISAITYVLIAFVGVSLIVSSIMIGVITYISVIERTKEIGVLRSVGASKRDIKRVFTAENFIIGLTSGLFGIVVALLLTIPLNFVLKHYTGIFGLAKLPALGAVILIAVSVLLTFIAGLIPARLAAKKDPVVALRTE